MTNDVTLNLSDLVHGLTPEPQLPQQNNQQWPEEDEVPAVGEEEMARIRMRVSEFSSIREILSDREKELFEFIQRLLINQGSNYTQDQLLSQASTISSLLTQRDFLLRQREEERERWESERQGWDRIAEALIRTKMWGGSVGEEAPPMANPNPPWQPERDGYSGIRKPEETLNPQLVFAELDNKELRQKLSDTQQRLTTLESQLTNLRPLLLVQPGVSRAAYAYPSSSQPQAGPSTPRVPQEAGGGTDIHLTDERPGSPSKEGESRPFPIPATYQHYRNAVHAYPSSKRHHHSSPSSKKQTKDSDKGKDKDKTKKRKSTPLTSDARAEHLLLAAQRLGRERAFVLGGIMQLQKEKRKEVKGKEKERERDGEGEKEREKEKEVQKTPKTPRVHGTKISFASSSKDNTGSKSNQTPGKGRFPVPSQGSFHLLNTPAQKTAVATPSTGRTMGTPLDSLLSAARMMDVSDLDDEENEQEQTPVKPKGNGKERKRARKAEMPESPVPKRRRTTTATNKDKDKSTASNDHWDSLPTMDNSLKSKKNAADAPINTSAHLQSLQSLAQRRLGGERVRSALDVLADQAAAYSSNDKGKGRADAAGWSLLKPVQWDVEGGEEGGRELDSSPVGSPRRENVDVEGRALRHPQVITKEHTVQVDAGASTERPGSPQEETSPTQTPTVERALKPPITHLENQGAANGAPSPVLASASDTNFIPDSPSNVPLSSASVSIPSSALVPIPTSPPTIPSASNAHPISNANLCQPRTASIPTVNDSNSASTDTHPPVEDSTTRSETAPGLEIDEMVVSFDEDPEMEQGINRDIESVRNLAESSGGFYNAARKTRNRYIKWSQEEDDLLAQAVARYGQKWDLVQKALPTRGYHQVRQRWLRKLGVFDTNLKELPPEVGLLGNTNIIPYGQSVASGGNNRVGLSNGHPPPQPRLGLAPLSSELALNKRS